MPTSSRNRKAKWPGSWAAYSSKEAQCLIWLCAEDLAPGSQQSACWLHEWWNRGHICDKLAPSSQQSVCWLHVRVNWGRVCCCQPASPVSLHSPQGRPHTRVPASRVHTDREGSRTCSRRQAGCTSLAGHRARWGLLSYLSDGQNPKICCRLVAKSCPTVCRPMDSSPAGSSVHRIPQARILEWVANSSSRGSSWPRDQTHIFCIDRTILYSCATREANSRLLLS